MAEENEQYRESDLAALADSIRATVRRLDESALAAAERIRDAETRLGEGTLTQADAEAKSAAAYAASPYARGIITMLSNLEGLPGRIQRALPELVNDNSIARIAAALRFIDDELNDYFADSDPGHLTKALGPGLQSYHRALRRSFGYWQMGRDPAGWPPVVADLDLRPERRDKPPASCSRRCRAGFPARGPNCAGR